MPRPSNARSHSPSPRAFAQARLEAKSRAAWSSTKSPGYAEGDEAVKDTPRTSSRKHQASRRGGRASAQQQSEQWPIPLRTSRIVSGPSSRGNCTLYLTAIWHQPAVVPKATSALCFFLSYCTTHPVTDGLLLLGLTWGIGFPVGYVVWTLRR